MSNDVTRSEVTTFVKDDKTLVHFQMFTDMVLVVLQNDSNVKASTVTLISRTIGIAVCLNTIRDSPWADATVMTDRLLKSTIALANSIP